MISSARTLAAAIFGRRSRAPVSIRWQPRRLERPRRSSPWSSGSRKRRTATRAPPAGTFRTTARTTRTRAEHDPSVVFNRLFTGNQGPSQSTQLDQARSALHKSVLDVVLEDANALKGRVSSRDKVRLDQHMAEHSSDRAAHRHERAGRDDLSKAEEPGIVPHRRWQGADARADHRDEPARIPGV